MWKSITWRRPSMPSKVQKCTCRSGKPSTAQPKLVLRIRQATSSPSPNSQPNQSERPCHRIGDVILKGGEAGLRDLTTAIRFDEVNRNVGDARSEMAAPAQFVRSLRGLPALLRMTSLQSRNGLRDYLPPNPAVCIDCREISAVEAIPCMRSLKSSAFEAFSRAVS